MQSTRQGMSFKKFIVDNRKCASRRLEVERSLLLEAFRARGKIGYKDYMV